MKNKVYAKVWGANGRCASGVYIPTVDNDVGHRLKFKVKALRFFGLELAPYRFSPGFENHFPDSRRNQIKN